MLLWSCLIAGVVPRAAGEKSGVSPSSVSLPSGPGSISGMGESFDVQLNTGTLSFSVPIRVPPGVAGAHPSLALAYNPGIPNGPFGPGWSLGGGAIQRRTDDGQPTFTEADTFSDTSGEKLVRMEDGTYRRELEQDGQHARVSRLGEGWLWESKTGTIMRFGQYPNAQEPDRHSRVYRNHDGFQETQSWMLDELEDVNGNRVRYFYQTFPESPGEGSPLMARGFPKSMDAAVCGSG